MASLRFLPAMGLLWLPLPPEELPLTTASGLELVRFLGVEGALDTMSRRLPCPLPPAARRQPLVAPVPGAGRAPRGGLPEGDVASWRVASGRCWSDSFWAVPR